MKYLNYDNNGKILGFYDTDIHAVIPDPKIQITMEQWLDCIDNQGFRSVDTKTKTLIKLTPPTPTLDELKAQAKTNITSFASDTRAQVAGQVDQYKLAGWNDKSQRAQRVLAGNASEADIAILQAECDKRGKSETPQQLAQQQASKGQALATAVAIIDGMEAAALAAIDAKRSATTLAALSAELQAKANIQLSQLVGG